MNFALTSTNQTCGIKIVEAEANAEKALNRVAGQRLELAVDIDASTTAALSAAIRIRPENSSHWTEIPMQNSAGKVWWRILYHGTGHLFLHDRSLDRSFQGMASELAKRTQI